MRSIKLDVKGMSCGLCAISIEDALKKIGASGQVDLDREEVTVRYDEDRLSLETIKAAIEEEGYEVVGAEPEGANMP